MPHARVAAEAADLAPQPRRLALGGGLSYTAADQDSATMHVGAMQLAARYALDERWSFSADAGLLALSSSPERGDADAVVAAGNPTLLGYLHLTPELALGAGFALPVASIGDGSIARLRRAAYNFATAMDGLSRVWLWAANRAAVVTSAQWSAPLHHEVALRAELWPTVLWRARGGVGGNDIDLFAPSALTFLLTRGPLQPGVGLSAVWMLTNQLDRAQLSIEPQLRVQLPDAFFELRYTVNIDEPLAGARGTGVWAIHVAGGGQL